MNTRVVLALALAVSAAGAGASEPEGRGVYSALDTLRRAEVGTFSPRLRQERESRPRESRRPPSEPSLLVVCKPYPAEPGSLICEERK